MAFDETENAVTITSMTAPTVPDSRPRGRLGRRLGMLGVSVYGLLVRGRDKVFSLGVAGSFHSFGHRSVLQTPIRLKNSSQIVVGSGVFVGGGSWLQVLDEYTGDEPALVIGDGTSVVGRCVLSAAASVRLGANVLLARNVYISDHSHRFDDTTLPVLAQGVAKIEPVEIGDGAWLAENVVVLPGVRIGRGSVVGANSVVADDVPDYCVAVGQPARVIKCFGPGQPTS
jgi:carbonic anhydrase/acetyltransferase-like protein (isoleucine patch superfamily)